jgi:hypothetical protein
MASKFGPERGTERWKEQVDRISRFMRTAVVKADIDKIAFMYITDTEYSRSAITQAIHDVEVEKGWH